MSFDEHRRVQYSTQYLMQNSVLVHRAVLYNVQNSTDVAAADDDSRNNDDDVLKIVEIATFPALFLSSFLLFSIGITSY